MGQVKRLIMILLGEALLTALLLVIFVRRITVPWIIGAVFVLQLGIIMFQIMAVLLPAAKFEATLEQFGERAWTEIEFLGLAEKVPYMEQVREVAEWYAVRKTRENSAAVFNKQTELTALQSQINPHFLYNTLESIRGQALMDDNTEIARMVEALGAFFRYSISRKGNLVTLRDELANIDNYMLIQRYRFNNRFSMEVIIDEEDEAAYDFVIPRLIIQPVVENAIFHGLEEKLEGGRVTIEVVVTEANLILMISDNGKGIGQEKLERLNARIRSRGVQLEEAEENGQRNTGIALPNIHKRIQILFGEEYGVNVYSTEGLGTDVEITMPVNDGRGRGKRNEKGDIADQ
ncbi:sensor histidine kinase [Lachnospiraceae bacterium JLR.KK008]